MFASAQAGISAAAILARGRNGALHGCEQIFQFLNLLDSRNKESLLRPQVEREGMCFALRAWRRCVRQRFFFVCPAAAGPKKKAEPRGGSAGALYYREDSVCQLKSIQRGKEVFASVSKLCLVHILQLALPLNFVMQLLI
jgi:hypothetical protein